MLREILEGINTKLKVGDFIAFEDRTVSGNRKWTVVGEIIEVSKTGLLYTSGSFAFGEEMETFQPFEKMKNLRIVKKSSTEYKELMIKRKKNQR